jgi:hypothetical protein
MTWHADHTFTVTTAGSSIEGLCNALTFRSNGATVNVLERVPGPMVARSTGILIKGNWYKCFARRERQCCPKRPAAVAANAGNTAGLANKLPRVRTR